MSARMPTLTTDRLVLRAFTHADIANLVRFAGSDEVHATTLNIPSPYTDQHAIDWIATHQATLAAGHGVVWAIADGQSDELVGTIDIRLQMIHKRGEIGYWVGPPHWGKGYATEAVRAVLGYGFGELGLYRIYADHFAGNDASGRVLTKVGMTQEGTLRGQFVKAGRHIDTVLYAIIKPDYESPS